MLACFHLLGGIPVATADQAPAPTGSTQGSEEVEIHPATGCGQEVPRHEGFQLLGALPSYARSDAGDGAMHITCGAVGTSREGIEQTSCVMQSDDQNGHRPLQNT